MTVIAPFKGIRYNQEKVGSLDSVVTPPYDVISPEEELWFMGRHPNNIVRLILPRENSTIDKYDRAGAVLQEWMDSEILIRDNAPSFYACEQEFEINGEWKRRLGLTCLVRLEDYGGGVMPHENILSSPLEDRMNLMRATKSNLDSVFGLFPGNQTEEIINTSITGDPDAVAVDKKGVKCSLWRISEPEVVDAIVKSLASEKILIADGHHRYAAALAYRNEMRAAAQTPDPNAPYEFVMMTLVSLQNKGLVVLPTHRMVRGLENFDPGAFFSRISELFELKAAAGGILPEKLKSTAGKHTFGIYLGEEKSYLMSLKSDVSPEKLISTPGSDALKRLDVSVLHSLVLEKFLGIGTQQLSSQSHLKYTQDPEMAMRSVDSGESQIALFLKSTPVSDVLAVASEGDRMPQKSTYFYPKLLTGLILRVM